MQKAKTNNVTAIKLWLSSELGRKRHGFFNIIHFSLFSLESGTHRYKQTGTKKMLFFYRLLKTNDVFVLTHESKSPNLLPVHHFYNYILNYDLDFLLTLYCRNKDFFSHFYLCQSQLQLLKIKCPWTDNPIDLFQPLYLLLWINNPYSPPQQFAGSIKCFHWRVPSVWIKSSGKAKFLLFV